MLRTPIQLYFWNREKNFGDQLAVSIAEHFGYSVEYSEPKKCECFSVGSILATCPLGFDGVVLGSGHMRSDAEGGRLKRARVLGVRGPLTARIEGLEGKVDYGDPGLLASIVFGEAHDRRDKIGIVPHYVDKSQAVNRKWLSERDDVLLIDVRDEPSVVAAAIMSCRVVLSSSLHGLVLADSYGIPAVWLKYSDEIVGGNFKYDDYHLSIELQRTCCEVGGSHELDDLLGSAVTADRAKVSCRQQSLISSYEELWNEIKRIRVKRNVKKMVRLPLKFFRLRN